MSESGNQALTGAAGGAASGAAVGSVVPGIGTVIGAVVGGVLGGIGGYLSGSSADSQFSNQQAWAAYNAKAAFVTNQNNINSRLSIAFINAALAKQVGRRQAEQITAAAAYNARIISQTTEYNVDLLENQLEDVWQAKDLDLSQLEIFRARERGNIVADQASSGTVIGEGSNADVVIGQMAQEALDATVIQFNADSAAASINNEIAKSRWQGQVAISQTLWDGQLSAFGVLSNAQTQSISGLSSALLQSNADTFSAKQGFLAGKDSILQASGEFKAQGQQNLVSGLFGAASTAATSYYGNRQSTQSSGVVSTRAFSNSAQQNGAAGTSVLSGAN